MNFRRGSSGADVTKIQKRLGALGLYLGPPDGSFGGGTESSLKVFQRNNGLDTDGCVGPATWAKLFPGGEKPTPSDLLNQPLALR